MSDVHLYLGDESAAFTGDCRMAWYDESHGSTLALAPQTSRLVEISLQPNLQQQSATRQNQSTSRRRSISRSQSAPTLAPKQSAHDPQNDTGDDTVRRSDTDTIYDFTQTTAPHIVNGTIVLVRLSLDRRFLAIQKSDVEVQVVCLTTNSSYWVVCQPKAGNRILADGVLWNTHASMPQSSQDLFLVTRLGIEQYRVSPKRRSCALHRTIGVYVHTFWYSAPHSVLIVSTGSRANELVPFSMKGMNVEKLPRLVFSTEVRKRDLYLASLYGELFAIYGDMKTARLLLYSVTKDKVSCVRSLHLMLPAGSLVEFSVVDNLLVCHSVEFSVSLFFDVKCDINAHDPFSHPLPVSLTPLTLHSRLTKPSPTRSTLLDPTRPDDDLLPSFRSNEISEQLLLSTPSPTNRTRSMPQVPAHMNHLYHESNKDNDCAISPWRFLAPDLVQRSITAKGQHSRVEIHRFHLNLEQVCRSCAQHSEILPFLLRRGDQEHAKRLALGIVRERLEEQAMPPAAASALLASVQTVSRRELKVRGGGGASDDSANDTSSDDEIQFRYGARAVVPVAIRKRFFREGRQETSSASMLPTRNANGLILIFQSELWVHVWKPLLETPSVSSQGILSTYLIEFIRLQRQNQVAVETITYIALVKAFLLAGKANELSQMLHYHAVEDSIAIADLLIEQSKTYSSLTPLALEMYTRLGDTARIVEVLLESGDVDQAITVAWKHMKKGIFDASVIPGSHFFESCVRRFSELKSPSRSLVAQQRLHSLWLFLQIWDSDCLIGEPSQLARSVSVPFPDSLLPASSRVKWCKIFGFSVPE